MRIPLPLAKLPETIPAQVLRPTQEDIPSTLEQRQHLLELTRRYVTEFDPVPPMPMSELREHAQKIHEAHGIDEKFLGYTATLINNAMWQDKLASVPYERVCC